MPSMDILLALVTPFRAITLSLEEKKIMNIYYIKLNSINKKIHDIYMILNKKYIYVNIYVYI